MATQVAQSTSFRLSQETLDRLRDLSERSGLSQTKIVTLMIDQVYRKYEDGNDQIITVLGIG